MLNEIRENKYPICDADVWVYACFGDVVDRLFEIHNKIVVADVVEGEILKWKSNDKFKYVANTYEYYKTRGRILVICHKEHIPLEHRKILEGMLTQFGFQNYFSNVPPEKDKGEYVSAIYADYFNISLFRTNDNLFAEGGRGRKDFPDLNIQNWYDTLRTLVPDNAAFIKINKMIQDEEERCEYYKEQRNLNRSYENKEHKKESLDLVTMLRGKWN